MPRAQSPQTASDIAYAVCRCKPEENCSEEDQGRWRVAVSLRG